MGWERQDAGWYNLYNKQTGCRASVCREGDGLWCVYINEDMPPGDSRHRTLREAKAEAERRVRDGE